jgi:hypothetical protein
MQTQQISSFSCSSFCCIVGITVASADETANSAKRSRDVQWQLIGDLSSAVRSFKAFDVTEEVFVTALIARISSSCILAPTDYIMQWQPEGKDKEPPGNQQGFRADRGRYRT